MTKRTKLFLGIGVVILLAAMIAAPLLLRRMEAAAQRRAALDALHGEMIAAYPLYAEGPPSNPAHQLYIQRRNELLAAGYLVEREIPMRAGFTSTREMHAFIASLAKRFPGVELKLRELKSEQPMVRVIVREEDLNAAVNFIRDHRASP